MRPACARWKLGKALAKAERVQGNRTSLSGLTKLLASIGLTKPTALAAQRIGTLPEKELRSAFTEWKARGDLRD